MVTSQRKESGHHQAGLILPSFAQRHFAKTVREGNSGQCLFEMIQCAIFVFTWMWTLRLLRAAELVISRQPFCIYERNRLKTVDIISDSETKMWSEIVTYREMQDIHIVNFIFSFLFHFNFILSHQYLVSDRWADSSDGVYWTTS